jgi:glycosyltransferase involved in cell wall biosynthesis
VLGPLGGGERAPLALRRGLPWRGWLKDLVRDLHTWLIRFDPITRRACAQALVVYVKTRESRAALPARFHPKIAIEMEIGIPPGTPPERPERAAGTPLRLLYAGRFLYWKGMHLGLRALAAARARGAEAELTMLGRGPDEASWRALARDLGLDPTLTWLSWVPHARMAELYHRHDALLFPSLHDSSGNAVLESLAQGLPVICLDLGGPGTIVDPTCGRVVATAGRSEAQCVAGLADAIVELSRSPALGRALGAGARARAAEFYWPKPVVRLYDDVARRLAG